MSHEKLLNELIDQHAAGVEPSDAGAMARALRSFYDAVLETAQSRFTGDQRGLPCSRLLCGAADVAVRHLADCVDARGLSFCWVATGGYGRGMLSPGSTVRVMLLHQSDDLDLAHRAGREADRLLGEALPRVSLEVLSTGEAMRRMTADTLHASDLLETRPLAGATDLHDQFRAAVIEDFLRPGWGRFGEEALEESLARRDPYTSSPYRTELNLKESAGALRDVGTLKKVADALLQVPELQRFWQDLGGAENGILLRQEREDLDRSLALLVKIRNELQFTLGPGFDVLEMHAQPTVAAALGYGDAHGEPDEAVASMMHEIFHHTGRIAGLLRSVNERFSHVHAVAWSRPTVMKRRELENDFVEVEGKIYNAASPPFEGTEGARRMLEAFLLSQRRHMDLSQELLEQISHHLDLIDDEVRADRRAAALFTDLLSGSVGVADRLGWMRDCGLLQAYIPELEPIVHIVRYRESYDYTLDEHTVEAARVIDRLAHTREENELAQREILSRIQRPDLLRLALLLHHLEGGAETAVDITRRTGLSTGAVETMEFLVREQDLLNDLARRRELDDADKLREIAGRIGSPERLRMLYLLTYADSRAVGRLGWFAWLDALLYELYHKLLSILEPGVQALATPEAFRQRLLSLADAAGMREKAEQFAGKIPERYAIEVTPQEALGHVELLDRLDGDPAAMSWELERHTARIWLCTSDVPARFSQVAGVLTAHDLNILNAHAFSLADGTVLDRFIVHRQRGPINNRPEFWQEVRDTLLASVSGELDLDALVAERMQRDTHEPLPPTRRRVTNIHFDNESSSRFTIVDLVTWDRLGLLYSVGKCLSELGANIEFALISTRLDVAEDVFYVSDETTGEKITSEERLHQIRSRLQEAAGQTPEKQPPGQ